MALGPALFVAIELCSPPTIDGQVGGFAARHALASAAWIAAWWITEAIPIALTSLMPLILFPVLGLGTPDQVSEAYGNEILFLFLGGLILARAMSRCGLHRRIALAILGAFGRREREVVLGFMVATAALSMWISNTATTVMILPVALAVLGDAAEGSELNRPFDVALLLGIAFAANIGGLGTPIGSPPALVFQSVYAAQSGESVSFLEWMLYGVPLMAALLPATWWYLTRGLGKDEIPAPRKDAVTLAPLSREERWVAVAFAGAAFLWITRTGLGPFPGWGGWLAEQGVTAGDSTVAIMVVIGLAAASSFARLDIVNWKETARDLPWGVLLLMGAGFAISGAFERSGLTRWIGQGIAAVGVADLPAAWLVLVLLMAVVTISVVVTEFASNTASASVLLPILYGACVALGPEVAPVEPLMVACAMGCTAGFALPAGTPPNALAFSTDRISMAVFVRRGAVVDGIGFLAITGVMSLWIFLDEVLGSLKVPRRLELRDRGGGRGPRPRSGSSCAVLSRSWSGKLPATFSSRRRA